MRHLSFPQTVSVCAAALSFSLATLQADDFGDKGREIFQKNHQAVVTVEVVQKTSATSRSAAQEVKADLSGTVINPSGLVVVALSTCDPSELYRRMSAEYKTEVDVSDVKIMLEDGTELPAEIVLRDKDLDLAFIRPKAKVTTPLTAIDLSKSSPAQLLDEVIALNRLKRAAGRAYSASPERISAVIQKPRTFYIPNSNATETGLGCPVFNLNGNILGMVVMRAVNAQGSGSWRDSLTGIILPAEDIMKAAAQAPEAKPEVKKEAPAKDATTSTNKVGDGTDAAKEAVAPILAPNTAK